VGGDGSSCSLEEAELDIAVEPRGRGGIQIPTRILLLLLAECKRVGSERGGARMQDAHRVIN
jgi:hypothetical protein